MKVRLWGTRGSLATPGPETALYGGNTSCVEVRGDDGTEIVLDAGTGVRALGRELEGSHGRVDVLLTHLHMDHIQGLGFFEPLHQEGREVHVWGPASTTQDLRARLMRYLSPPLFPVHLRDLPCRLELHEVPVMGVRIGELTVDAIRVCHPGPTVGYRIAGPSATMAYLPDHEPALGTTRFPLGPDWTSGFELARDVDLLIHDAQFTSDEYPSHVGWGHSSGEHAVAFAALAGVKRLVPFHHDPSHDDAALERTLAKLRASAPPFEIVAGREGTTIDL